MTNSTMKIFYQNIDQGRTNFLLGARLFRRALLPARPIRHAKNGRPKQKSTSDRDEFAKLRALHAFVPSRLMCLDLYAY